jgi:competence protein ComEA
MIKKLIVAVAAMIAMMGFAFAQVDVNKADKAALDAVKGIGPVMSKTIIDERTKGGAFKDWADFQARVKGVADKKAAALSEAGLQVNGQARAAASAASAASKASAASAASKASMASAASAASKASMASMASAASAASKASMASAASAASKASAASAASPASAKK